MTRLRRLPFLGRLAGRYALRHKGQTLRAIAGLFVATAVLVAGFGLTDSVATTFEREVAKRYGPIDVLVTAPFPFPAALTDEAVRATGAEGVATLVVPGAAHHAAKGLAEGRALVRGVAAGEPGLLGALAAPGGGTVPDPGPGEVVLSEGLARTLEAAPGDRVTLRVPTRDPGLVALEATVAAVATEGGRGGFLRGPMALVPAADLEEATGLRGMATVVLVRAADASGAADAIRAALPEEAGDTVEVRAVKVEARDEAESNRMGFFGFLMAMSSFTLIASVLLAFTLFTGLVEERRSELGIARALGLSRGEVALTMTLEGALYAGAAALTGVLVGLGLLAGLVRSFDRFGPEWFPDVQLAILPGSLLLAASLGILLPLVTIGLASLRFARLDPARAIRGIPDDPKGRRRAGFGGAALLLALGALLALAPLPRLLGVPLLFAGAALGLAATGRGRAGALVALAGAAVVVGSLYAFEFPAGSGELDPLLTMGRGLLLAAGFAALAVASPAPYDALARLAGRGARAPGVRNSVVVAARYLVARRRPAGLTMAMIAIVVMVVTMMGTLMALFSGAPADTIAGYEVKGETPLALDTFPGALPPDVAPLVAGAEFLPAVGHTGSLNLSYEGRAVGNEWGLPRAIGVTASFAENNAIPLLDRAPRYATDRDAWRAVAAGEAIVVPREGGSDQRGVWGAAPGERLTLSGPGGPPREYVLAGYDASEPRLWSFFVEAERVDAMAFQVERLVLLRTTPGTDAAHVAARLTAAYAQEGITLESVREEQLREAQAGGAFLLVFEAFLALGLLVGLASTGLLASRAVHERMRDIGTLRALGFEEADVRRAFLLEQTFTAALGILVGIGVGILVSHSVWWREIRETGAPYSAPALVLATFGLAVITLAGLSAWGPAKRAARLPPALAVRHVD